MEQAASAVPRGSARRVRRAVLWFLLLCGFALAAAPVVRAQTDDTQPLSEEIQRRREEMERKKREYLEQKARVDDLNRRVRQYKALRDSIPLLSIPGTTNLMRMYVNQHDIEDVARALYFLTDGATEQGFRREYWPMVLALNQGDKYENGVPEYGPLDPEDPDANQAVFPNIRKRDMEAVVANITHDDTLFALQYTTPAVRAYRKRLKELALRLAAETPEPPPPTGPERLSGEARVAVFQKVTDEVRDVLPPRKIRDETRLAYTFQDERPPVRLDAPINLEPAPPAYALRHGVNMLGPEYQGYNVKYEPGDFQLRPEAGVMAFYGGRTPKGEARTQPGVWFSFNQKFLKFLLLNETAFAAFSVSDAPSVNGGSLNAGLDFDLGMLNVSVLGGITAFNAVNETETGVNFLGRAGIPVGPRVYLGVMFLRSNASVFQGSSKTGIVDPGFGGLSITIR